MHVRHLGCLSEGGIFMECKKICWNFFLLFLSCLIILIISLGYLYEVNKLKEILFYDYSFGNVDAINEEINNLGFKYKKNFDEVPEKKIINKSIQMQNFFYQENSCIIIFSNSSTCEKRIKKILNSKTEMELQQIHLPDDMYNKGVTNVYLWNFDDRKIYMVSYNNIHKTYIEKRYPYI